MTRRINSFTTGYIFSQPVAQPAQPTVQPVAQPVVQSVAQPVAQPVALPEPVAQGLENIRMLKNFVRV